MKKLLFIAAIGLMLASCSEDYKDWANPQTNDGTSITFGDGSVTPVDVINFNLIDDTVQKVKVCNIVPPTVSDTTYKTYYTIHFIGESDDSFSLDEDGMMYATLLQQFVIEKFGHAPVQRDIPARVEFWMTDGETSKVIYSGDFTVSVIPAAPVISSAYYYIGTSNGWAAHDATYPLTNGGGDVYDDPVFTVVVDAAYNEAGERQDNWFKIYSQETMEAGDDVFWSSDFIGYAVNGENELTGKFVEGANDVVAFAFKIPASLEADKYRLTFDMLNSTFTIEPIINKGTPDLWYLVGEPIGNGSWDNFTTADIGASLIPMLPNPEKYSELCYIGYLPAGKGFKLIHTPGDWNEQWGMDDTGAFVQNDGGSANLSVAEDGYYTITFDQEMNTLTISKYAGAVNTVNAIYMPGAYNGWDAAANAMNGINTVVENHDWIVTDAVYSENTELKFAANGNWDINWGAAEFPVGAGTQGGANILVNAGSYTVMFNDILGWYYFMEK